MGEEFKVVVNHEEQYSIWPADRENPPGWRDVGVKGSNAECLDYLRGAWAEARDPRNELEEAVAHLWKKMLDVDQVGIHDSFSELGGHSLKAVELVVRVYDVFRVDVPLEVFFEQPTIAGLARGIAWRQRTG